MAATLGIIGSVAGIASAGVGIANAVGGGGGTKNSGGTPQTATGGQTANLLSGQQMGMAGNQYLSDAIGLQGYGTGYASQFFPQVQSATYAAANNPFAGQAIGGAQGASAYGFGSLAPYQTQGAQSLAGLAGQFSPYVNTALGQAFSPSQTGQYQSQFLQGAAGQTPGAAYTGQALSQAFNPLVGSQYTNQALSQAFSPTLGGQYANQALATGFSPNNGLYNQQLHQTIDQSNAINSMYGLGSSPYGAGLTDQAVQNFNNAFNLNQAQLQGQAANTYNSLMNQQLATQAQGLQGFGTLANANMANQAQGLNAYTGLMNVGLANQTGNLNAYSTLANADLNRTLGLAGLASTLGGQAGSLYQSGAGLGQGAFGTLQAAGGLPANTYQTLSGNALQALGIGAQNANATLNPYTTYLNSLGNIIGLGQIGQQNAAQQAQAGFDQSQTSGQNMANALAGLGGTNGQPSPLKTLWDAISGPGVYNPYQQVPYQISPDQIPSYDTSSLSLPDLSMFG